MTPSQFFMQNRIKEEKKINPSQDLNPQPCETAPNRTKSGQNATLCTEVEALAKNYYSFKQILKKNCVVNYNENTDFQNL